MYIHKYINNTYTHTYIIIHINTFMCIYIYIFFTEKFVFDYIFRSIYLIVCVFYLFNCTITIRRKIQFH